MKASCDPYPDPGIQFDWAMLVLKENMPALGTQSDEPAIETLERIMVKARIRPRLRARILISIHSAACDRPPRRWIEF